MDVLTTMAITAFVQGYGDIEESHPNFDERAVLLFTNAARVDPQAHEEEYNKGNDKDTPNNRCSTDFFKSEELIAKRPLYWAHPLGEAARYHSQDMKDNNYFAHESRDGTSAAARVARWYDESGIGENIAMGYMDAWEVTIQGWMCSAGHRSNIMYGGWTELGTGVVGTHYTQNFGAGEVDTWMSIPMGVHWPQAAQSGSNTAFYADYLSPNFGLEGGSLEDGPFNYHVVVDGLAHPMDLEWGDPARGVFKSVVQLTGSQDCHQYFFIADDAAGEHRFPEEGSYLVGACDQQDFPDMYVDSQLPIEGREAADMGLLKEGINLVGCSSTRQSRSTWTLLGVLGLLGLRRRRSNSSLYRP
jgi:MYXO-CTERM domain-containing protein